jgi:hypothetical protein
MPKKQTKPKTVENNQAPVVSVPAAPVEVAAPVVAAPVEVAAPAAVPVRSYSDLRNKLVRERNENQPESKEESNQNNRSGFVRSSNRPRVVRRPGRTLLVKPATQGVTFQNAVFEASRLTGLQSRTESSASSSLFLTFDTVENAKNAFSSLRNERDYRVKFSYYRVFFTITGLTDTSDYNEVKKTLVTHVETNSHASVLYFKLYRKDNKYIGCGDFTMDTMEGMNALLAKDSNFKTFTLGSLTGTFYRYNANKGQGDEDGDDE